MEFLQSNNVQVLKSFDNFFADVWMCGCVGVSMYVSLRVCLDDAIYYPREGVFPQISKH